jgi:protein subunit release factor B
MFPVTGTKGEALAARMARFGIREEDLEEQFVCSSGKGGQNVNKVATCVWLTHRPSGIQVKCQRERAQALNRYHARCLLCDRLERRILGAASAEEQRIEKVRRQKRRRSRRAKEKMLRDKHARTATKIRRGRVDASSD